MRKKLTMAAVAAMMAVSAYVGAKSLTPSERLNGIMLENVEALANEESLTGCKWRIVQNSSGAEYNACLKNGTGDNCKCGDVMYM